MRSMVLISMLLNVMINLMAIDLDPLMQAITIFILLHTSIVVGPELVKEKKKQISKKRAKKNKPDSSSKITEIMVKGEVIYQNGPNESSKAIFYPAPNPTINDKFSDLSNTIMCANRPSLPMDKNVSY